QGTLQFPTPPDSTIAIYYTKGGLDLGDNDLAEDILPDNVNDSGIVDIETALPFSWVSADPFDQSNGTIEDTSMISLNNGNDCYILKKPGVFSPLEFYNHYSKNISFSEEQWRRSAELIDLSHGELSSKQLQLSLSDNYIQIFSAEEDIRSLESRYPFIDIMPDLYGPLGNRDSQTWEIRVFNLGGKGNYLLPSNVVEGSLDITINGNETQAYVLNQDKTLTFNRFIYPTDRIVVDYQLENSDYSGAEILGYQGNRFEFSDKNSLEIALNGRWKLPGSTVLEQQSQISLSGYHEYTGDNLQSRLSLQSTFIDPDSDGLKLLKGMENQKTYWPIYPSKLLESYSFYDEINLYSTSYTPLEKLDYENSQGNVENYLFSSPLETDEYGPSAALPLSSDPISTPVMLFPFDLSSGQWTGGSYMFFDQYGTAPDFSDLQNLEFYVKLLDGSGDGSITLLLGETGETDNYSSEDFISTPDSDLYISKDLDDLDANWRDGDWHKISLELTPLERQRLQSCSSLTLLIEDTSAIDSSSGTLIVGELYLDQGEFHGQVYNSLNQPIDGSIVISQSLDDSLAIAYPEVMSNFHSNGESQSVAQIKWGLDLIGGTTALGVDQYWKTMGTLYPGSSLDYRYLSFYLRTYQTGGEYTLRFYDANGRYAEILYRPLTSEDTDWQKIQLDLQNKTLGNSNGSITLVEWDRAAEDFISLEIQGEGIASGTLEIDEIYLEEQLYQVENSGVWQLSYQSPIEWKSSSDFPLFSNWTIESEISGSSSLRLNSSDETIYDVSHSINTEANITLVRIGLNLDYSMDLLDAPISSGHSLKVPYMEFPISYQEKFNYSNLRDVQPYDQSKKILWSLDNISLQGGLEHRSQRESTWESQDWFYNLNTMESQNLTIRQQAQFHIKNTLTDGESDSDYWDRWLEAWSRLEANYQDPVSTESRYLQDVAIPLKSFTPRSLLDFHIYSGNQPQWMRNSVYSSELHLPYTWGNNLAQSFEIFYLRNSLWTQEEDQFTHFKDQWISYGGELSQGLPLFYEIPLVELFEENYTLNSDFENSMNIRKYTPTLGLQLQSPAKSDWKYLILPNNAKIALSRLYQVNTDQLQSYQQNLNFQWGNHSLNLFGSYGVYPTFNFYTSDEFISKINLEMSSLNQSIPEADNLNWTINWIFNGRKNLLLDLENQCKWEFDSETFSDQAEISFAWQSNRRPYYTVPFMDWIINDEFYLENQEKLSYKLTSPWDDQTQDIVQWSVSHHSLFHFTQLGILDSWIKWGYRTEEQLFQTGVEMGLELTISF
ncbi:MAG: hypothetical protein PF447_11360, partial [Spirochaetaceae bacterium]|nr:hypothetical protein [Spirochaetaceae bacterium]